MNRIESLRFLAVGLCVTAIGLLVFGMAMPRTGAAMATLLRLGVVVPLLYLGYSRYVLREVLASEKAEFGSRRAEMKMAGRVAAAIGASVAIKLVLEPPISFLLEHYYGQAMAYVSPLMADFFYGPLANYCVLFWSSRKAHRIDAPAGRSIDTDR